MYKNVIAQSYCMTGMTRVLIVTIGRFPVSDLEICKGWVLFAGILSLRDFQTSITLID